MNDSQHGLYQQQASGCDDRGNGRDRRSEYNYSQPQPGSPPTSASPFAFSPPPLSSHPGPGSSRPQLSWHHSWHHSEPTIEAQPYSFYPQQKPAVLHHNTFPSYPTDTSMYRSFSHDPQRTTQQTSLNRITSHSVTPTTGQNGMASQQSPQTYQRPPSNGYGASAQLSPQRQSLHQTQSFHNQSYSQPTTTDMPRSLSFPSNHSQAPYPLYHQVMSLPFLQTQPHPSSLDRHNTTSVLGEGMAEVDLGRQGPSLGYSISNRVPLLGRPFKCDECVQSFNRNHDLKRHKRIHLSIKPFGCEKCGKMFSRKDALRRHWLVKGCRGEDGATAPITPMFTSQTPMLSPQTPPISASPTEVDFSSSFSHSSAPPPLTTLPPRESSDNSSQLIVTPNEIAMQQQLARKTVPPLEEPLVIDPTLSGVNAQRSNNGSDGYFEGVVGLKQDGTALIYKNGTVSSPFSRHPPSPTTGLHPHPYRRPPTLVSPSKGGGQQKSSPTMQLSNPFSDLKADRKPVFAIPLMPQLNGSQASHQHDGMLAPAIGLSVKMDKQASADSGDPTTWQRWHRPSFPFPSPPGADYNFGPSSPAEAQYA